MLGIEFEGTGHTVEYEAGRRYAFTTEGGIDSKFVYEAAPAETGTNLNIRVDFDVPESLLSRAGLDGLIESMKQQDADQAAQNLKTILDQEPVIAAAQRTCSQGEGVGDEDRHDRHERDPLLRRVVGRKRTYAARVRRTQRDDRVAAQPGFVDPGRDDSAGT